MNIEFSNLPMHKNLTLNNAILFYSQTLNLTNLSKNTVRNFVYDINLFQRYLGENKFVNQIYSDDIQDWLLSFSRTSAKLKA